MKCPHCLEGFHEDWARPSHLGQDNDYVFQARECTCPSCHRVIVQLGKRVINFPATRWDFVYPKAISRSPIPAEVNDQALVDSYKESCLVLSDSPSASAALSRRCLQHILRENAKVAHSDLSAEIDSVIASNTLPSDLAGNLDAVRNIGNFAAHPIKSQNTGAILAVEPGEAEWNLDIVEELMDFYFVRPARLQKKKVALNIKLKEAGKPEIPV